MRCGRDLFVCNSSTTNRKGYDWLRRHFNRQGLRVHLLDFPDDTAPMHLDVNFVPLSSEVRASPNPHLHPLLRGDVVPRNACVS